jgi:hypothetical protein
MEYPLINRILASVESQFELGYCGTYALALHDLTHGKARLGMIRGVRMEREEDEDEELEIDVNVHSFVFSPDSDTYGIDVTGEFNIEGRAEEWVDRNQHQDPEYTIRSYSTREAFLIALKETGHPDPTNKYYQEAVTHIKKSGILEKFE